MPILFVFVIVDLLGFSLILPLLPYYARVFSASPLVIGLLDTANALAQMIAAPIIGKAVGPARPPPHAPAGDLRRVRLLPHAGSGAVHDAPLREPHPQRSSGGNIALAQAYITDITDEKDRAKRLGMIGAAFGIGFIIGPALGGLLSTWGYGIPAYAAAGLSLLNFL